MNLHVRKLEEVDQGMKEKSFRVSYAGQPDGAIFINALSWREAAYLFFANNPKKNAIVVETSRFTEQTTRAEELAHMYPEVTRLLAEFEGQNGVIQEALQKAHGLKSTEKADRDRESEI